MDAIEIGGIVMTYIGGIWAIIQISQSILRGVSLEKIVNQIKWLVLLAVWLFVTTVLFSAIPFETVRLPETGRVLLTFIAAMGVAVAVHVGTMAVVGSALGEKIDVYAWVLAPEFSKQP